MVISVRKKKIISIAISMFFFTAIMAYFYRNFHELKGIKELKTVYLFPIIILNLIYIYLNGQFSRIISEPFSINLKEHFLLSLAASFINLIAPFRAGVGLRAIYMKRKYNLSYPLFSASVYGNYIIIILISSILALLLMALIYLKYEIFNLSVTTIFFSLLIISILAMNSKLPFKNRIIDQINCGWDIIKAYPKTIIKLILNTLLGVVIYSLNIFLIFKGLNVDVGIIAAVYFTIMNVLSSFINLTPGSFGITEGLFLISAKILGISPAISLIVALISRAIGSIILLVLGPWANYRLFKKIQN